MLMAACSAATLSSCSDDDYSAAGAVGADSGEMEVTLTCDIPQGIDDKPSRTYSDGLKAGNLYYALYEKNGEELKLVETNKAYTVTSSDPNETSLCTTDAPLSFDYTKTRPTASVFTKLLIGHEYTITFVAVSSTSRIKFDPLNGRLKMDYSGACNDKSEYDDTFCNTVSFTAREGQVPSTVVLRRPLAQLNIGCILDNDGEPTYKPDKTQIKIAKVPYSYDLIKGDATNELTNADFSASASPDDSESFPVDDIYYSAMCYVFASKTQQTLTVTFKQDDEDAIEIDNVPLRSNYRTNIYGDLSASSSIGFVIWIEPSFTDEELLEHDNQWGGESANLNAWYGGLNAFYYWMNYSSRSDYADYDFYLTQDIEITGNQQFNTTALPWYDGGSSTDGFISYNGTGTLYLNGYSLTIHSGGLLIKDGSLTIEGPGLIYADYAGDTGGVLFNLNSTDASNPAKLVINDGEFRLTSSTRARSTTAFFTATNGYAYVHDGFFFGNRLHRQNFTPESNGLYCLGGVFSTEDQALAAARQAKALSDYEADELYYAYRNTRYLEAAESDPEYQDSLTYPEYEETGDESYYQVVEK